MIVNYLVLPEAHAEIKYNRVNKNAPYIQMQMHSKDVGRCCTLKLQNKINLDYTSTCSKIKFRTSSETKELPHLSKNAVSANIKHSR